MARSPDPIKTLRQEVGDLRKRVDNLEAERPGRKAAPMLAIKQHGVCALDPSIDSTECEKASIYRYQSGCHGHACRAKQSAAYKRRKTNAAAKKNATPVSVRKKAPPKKAAPKKAAPTKRLTSVKGGAPAKAAPAKKTIKRLAS